MTSLRQGYADVTVLTGYSLVLDLRLGFVLMNLNLGFADLTALTGHLLVLSFRPHHADVMALTLGTGYLLVLDLRLRHADVMALTLVTGYLLVLDLRLGYCGLSMSGSCAATCTAWLMSSIHLFFSS